MFFYLNFGTLSHFGTLAPNLHSRSSKFCADTPPLLALKGRNNPSSRPLSQGAKALYKEKAPT